MMVLPWRNADLSRTHVSFNLKLSKDGLSKIAMSKIISSKFISSAANAYETHSESAWFFLVSRPLWGLLKTTQQGLWAVVAGGGRLSVGGNKTHTVGLQPVVASQKNLQQFGHILFFRGDECFPFFWDPWPKSIVPRITRFRETSLDLGMPIWNRPVRVIIGCSKFLPGGTSRSGGSSSWELWHRT